MNGEQQDRFGFVAVIGAPNAGKSTLVNRMVGAKVSIVSPKKQTTRARVLGITIRNRSQIALIDTPGLFSPAPGKRLERAITAAAQDSLSGADAILLVIDATQKNAKDRDLVLKYVQEVNDAPRLLALNKIDKVRPQELLSLTEALNAQTSFDATFMISALNGDGVGDLMDHLARIMPESPWHYPEDQMTDMPLRLLAAEITREKLFMALRDELPYNLTVETESWEDFDDGSIRIDQTVYVARETHKKIILGKGGAMIKKVGQAAREDLQKILETRVHLKLFVKLRENWQDDPERFRLWGLDPGV